MKESKDLKVETKIALLLVGDPKTGKTCLASSFPAPFFLDIDMNLKSAVSVLGSKPFFYSQPSVEVGLSIDSQGKTLNAEKVWPKAMEELKIAAQDPRVQTIIIDGLTKLADFACEYILDEVSRMEGKKIQTLRIQDYGRFMSLYQRLVSFLRSLDKYIICTAHQTSSKNDITGAIMYALAIPGQLKDTFGGFFTDVWATVAIAGQGGKTKYELRTGPSNLHVALGSSVRTLDKSIDLTDKTPDQIWALLGPKLGAK